MSSGRAPATFVDHLRVDGVLVRWASRHHRLGLLPGLQRAGLVGGLHGWAAWRPRSYSWWITLANLIGSTAFGVSAVAGLRQPGDRQVHNAARADTQTLIGAVCFLIGAVLLLPERTEKVSGQIVARVGGGTVTSVDSSP